MITITRSTLRELARVQGWPSVSVYLPIVRGGVEGEQNDVRVRDALRRAETLLIQKGCSSALAESVLKEGRRRASEPSFLSHPGDGIALLMTEDRTWVFQLPVAVAEAVYVEKHLALGPLVPALKSAEKFLVLALSENSAKLYRAEGETLEPVAADLPENMREALAYDQPESQIHAISAGRYRNRKEGAVFHGQGASTMHVDAELHAYCREVSDAMAPVLAREDAPLVVAAADRLAAVFAEEFSDKHLIPSHVSGSTEHWSATDLLTRAREARDAHRAQTDAMRIAELAELAGRGRAATTPESAVRAACAGQVSELWVARGAALRGRFDRSSGEVHLAPRQAGDAEDLLETIIRETLLHDGDVHCVEAKLLPSTPVAARLRYAAF